MGSQPCSILFQCQIVPKIVRRKYFDTSQETSCNWSIRPIQLSPLVNLVWWIRNFILQGMVLGSLFNWRRLVLHYHSSQTTIWQKPNLRCNLGVTVVSGRGAGETRCTGMNVMCLWSMSTMSILFNSKKYQRTITQRRQWRDLRRPESYYGTNFHRCVKLVRFTLSQTHLAGLCKAGKTLTWIPGQAFHRMNLD